MAVSVGKRIGALAGVLFAVMAVLGVAPASAQTPGGSQATALVGVSDTANCPPGTASDSAAPLASGTSGAFTVGFPAGGSCQDGGAPAANSQGQYTVGGAGPFPFSSSCQTAGLQTGGGVFVPEGTVVNPGTPGQFVVGPGGTTITTANTVVRYPNGTTATLNVVQTTATTVTRIAIVSGGTQIGRVICGQSNVYPLAVDTAAAAPELPSPLSASDDGGGPSTGLLLVGGAIVLLALAQLAVVRTVRRRRGDAVA